MNQFLMMQNISSFCKSKLLVVLNENKSYLCRYYYTVELLALSQNWFRLKSMFWLNSCPPIRTTASMFVLLAEDKVSPLKKLPWLSWKVCWQQVIQKMKWKVAMNLEERTQEIMHSDMFDASKFHLPAKFKAVSHCFWAHKLLTLAVEKVKKTCSLLS